MKVQLGSGVAVVPMPQALQEGRISLAELLPIRVHGLYSNDSTEISGFIKAKSPSHGALEAFANVVSAAPTGAHHQRSQVCGNSTETVRLGFNDALAIRMMHIRNVCRAWRSMTFMLNLLHAGLAIGKSIHRCMRRGCCS